MTSPVTLKLINAAYDTAIDILRNNRRLMLPSDIDAVIKEIEQCKFYVPSVNTRPASEGEK